MWFNKLVRHLDGRKGRVGAEWVSLSGVKLQIECANGETETLLLSTKNPCQGTMGWEWYIDRHELCATAGKWLAFPAETPDAK